MRTRKEMKRQAKKVVHEHYWILLIVCLVAVYMGAEFSGSLDFVKQYRQENNGASGQIPPTRALTDAYHPIFTQAVWSALAGDVDGGREMAETATEQAIQNAEQNRLGRFFGRSRGVFASIINGIDSGSIIVNLISAAQGIGMSQNGIVAVFIGVAALLLFGIWFFLINMYKAISRRIFLETRTYKKVPIRRMLFFYRVKRWRRVSVTMFMTWLLQSLWSLTVIGGLVKRYSYYMVPYIAAENPDIGWKDTITLSRKMMVGHKWECFVFECTFILWNLAGIVTLGISNLFYANQYKVAAFSEYYADIRAQAKKETFRAVSF